MKILYEGNELLKSLAKDTGYSCPICGRGKVVMFRDMEGCTKKSCEMAHPYTDLKFFCEHENDADKIIEKLGIII